MDNSVCVDYPQTNPPPLLEIGKSPVGLLCLLMKMQRNANQPLLSIIGLLTKSYLLCYLIVYLLHLIQMKIMLMHGSIGINIRAVIALICLIIN